MKTKLTITEARNILAEINMKENLTKEDIGYAYIILKNKLKTMLKNLTKNTQINPDDLVQDAFLKVLDRGQFDRKRGTIEQFLFIVAKRIFLDEYRKDKTRNSKSTSLDTLSYNTANTLSTKIQNPEAQFILTETVANVRKRLVNLELWDLRTDGYGYQEIADKLNLNCGTVSSVINRQRAVLNDLKMKQII